MLYCHYRVGHERQKRNEHSADIHSSAAVKAERQYKRCRIKYQYKNPSSQAYAHVFSANFVPQTALKILAGRKPACGFLPTLQQNYARKSAHISYEYRFLFIQALLHIRRFKKPMVKDKSDCGCDDLRNRECEPESFQSES